MATRDNETSDIDPAMWQLSALTEALGDLTLTIDDSLSVGRGSDNDVVLGSKQVSRNHALLSVLNGKLYVKDLDSSNGTFINDQRIEGNKSKHLKAEDTLSFASFAFKVLPLFENTPVVTDPTATAQTPTTPAAKPTAETQTQTIVPTSIDKTAVDQTSQTTSTLETTPTSETMPIISDSTNELPATDEPVNKETIIADVLSAMPENTQSNKETVMSQDESKEKVVGETVENKPARHESGSPTSASNTHAGAPVSPEHDKTTTTELQREADPDVLRAKQAATAQFSGTANLGQGRDLGTEGNNAMDQAIDNPATSNRTGEKSSGTWFIWVFVIILIIGIAVWLFNMGSV